MTDTPLFDVIVFEEATMKIDSIVGSGLRYDTGHQNARSRLSLIRGRLNDLFDAEIVPHKRYNKGDIYVRE
jgi:hypothetical protein